MGKPIWVKVMGWIWVCGFGASIAIALAVSFSVGSQMRAAAEQPPIQQTGHKKTRKATQAEAAVRAARVAESPDNVTLIRQVAGAIAVLVLVCGPTGVLWLIGTLLHRSRVHRARIQAGAFSEILARGSPPVAVQAVPGPPAAPGKARTGPLGL